MGEKGNFSNTQKILTMQNRIPTGKTHILNLYNSNLRTSKVWIWELICKNARNTREQETKNMSSAMKRKKLFFLEWSELVFIKYIKNDFYHNK